MTLLMREEEKETAAEQEEEEEEEEVDEVEVEEEEEEDHQHQKQKQQQLLVQSPQPPPEPPEPEPEEEEGMIMMEETSVQKIARAALIMRDGNEIQRISIVRNIPCLMNEDPDECLFKLIPVVQDVLRTTGGGGGGGLELHLASSDAYKEVILIQHQRMQMDASQQNQAQDEDHQQDRANNNEQQQQPRVDLGLCSQILKGIVQNVESQESIACSAWLEALLDVVDHLPICVIRSRVLPMASQKAQQLNCVQSRLTATKLLGRLAGKLDAGEVKGEIVPLVQALCQDSNAAVRVSMCQQLPMVACSLRCMELSSLALPIVIEFSKDEDESVREANLETITGLMDAFDEDTRRRVLVPLMVKFVEDAMEAAGLLKNSDSSNPAAADPTTTAVSDRRPRQCTVRSVLALARNYGVICGSIHGYVDEARRRWLVERFCELCSLGADQQSADDDDERDQDEQQQQRQRQHQYTNSAMLGFSKYDWQTSSACRRHAAYNFPAVVGLASDELVELVLVPQFKRLCQDSDGDVRTRAAACFHEMADRSGDRAPLLIDSFVDLVYSGDPDVINALTCRLDVTLRCVYGAGGQQKQQQQLDANGNPTSSSSTVLGGPPYTQLTRILLACNRLIRNGGNWRSHEQLLAALACLGRFVSDDELCQSFVPMIKEEVVNARAVPCRLAALRTLVQWTKDTDCPSTVDSLVTYCLNTLAVNRSCHKRALFLDACRMLIECGAGNVVVNDQRMLDAALAMVHDPVSNVRLKFCKLLPLLNGWMRSSSQVVAPADGGGEAGRCGDRLRSVVQTLLAKENRGYMGETVRRVINEMARADAEPLQPQPQPPATGAVVNTARVTPVPRTDDEQQPPHKNEVDQNGNSRPPVKNTSSPEKETEKDMDNKEGESQGEASQKPPLAASTSATTSTTTSTTTSATTTTSSVRSSVFTSSSGKKTAIVQPRRLICRSPSPRPPLDSDVYQRLSAAASSSNNTSTTTTTTEKTQTRDQPKSQQATPPPSLIRPDTLTKTSSLKTSSEAPTSRRSESAGATSATATTTTTTKIGERVIPIRVVSGGSSSSSPSSTPTLSRPPTPASFGLGGRNSGSTTSVTKEPLTRTPSTTNVLGSAAARRSSTTTTTTTARSGTGIQSGTVSRSIQRFEARSTSKSAKEASTASASASSNSSSSATTTTSSSSSRRYSSTTARGLEYSRTMNRSFSSFGGRNHHDSSRDYSGGSSILSDSRKDYTLSYQLRPSSSYSSRLSSSAILGDHHHRRASSSSSASSSSYSLSRVRSGSSLSSGNY